MGKLLMKGYFGEPFKGPVILFGAMVEYHPISGLAQWLSLAGEGTCLTSNG